MTSLATYLRDAAGQYPGKARVRLDGTVLTYADDDRTARVAGWLRAWAGVKAHLDTVTERAAAPIIAKYTGVLAAADIEVFTRTTTFAIMQSLRLDSGPSGPVHP